VRLKDKGDFWPATGVWRALEVAPGCTEAAGGQGMSSMLAFLKNERERAGNARVETRALVFRRQVRCDHCRQPADLHLRTAVCPDRKDLAERQFWV
jgi:hypothetical protein